MKEQCKSTDGLDLRNSNYIGQISSEVGQLPRTHMLVVLTQVMANLKVAVETFAKQIRKKISFPTPLPCVLNFLGKLFPDIMLCMKVKKQRYFPALFTQ
jgi:hypothetical protein